MNYFVFIFLKKAEENAGMLQRTAVSSSGLNILWSWNSGLTLCFPLVIRHYRLLSAHNLFYVVLVSVTDPVQRCQWVQIVSCSWERPPSSLPFKGAVAGALKQNVATALFFFLRSQGWVLKWLRLRTQSQGKFMQISSFISNQLNKPSSRA